MAVGRVGGAAGGARLLLLMLLVLWRRRGERVCEHRRGQPRQWGAAVVDCALEHSYPIRVSARSEGA